GNDGEYHTVSGQPAECYLTHPAAAPTPTVLGAPPDSVDLCFTAGVLVQRSTHGSSFNTAFTLNGYVSAPTNKDFDLPYELSPTLSCNRSATCRSPWATAPASTGTSPRRPHAPADMLVPAQFLFLLAPAPSCGASRGGARFSLFAMEPPASRSGTRVSRTSAPP